jgi:hypothetical protein
MKPGSIRSRRAFRIEKIPSIGFAGALYGLARPTPGLAEPT